MVELTKAGDQLIISKKHPVPSLDEMLASIPEFEYPEDVADFVDREPLGNELL